MLGCRAAEHGYDDGVLGALIRHARRVHGEDKGERDDYVEKTVAAVRKRVGYVTSGRKDDELLAELTKALRRRRNRPACDRDARRRPRQQRVGVDRAR